MKVDVIMLSNTADEAIYQMTQAAIKGMQVADESATFNVILVETLPYWHLEEEHHLYPGVTTIFPYADGESFNYNHSLNCGFEYLSQPEGRGTTPCTVICNNDLVFRRGWFHELYMDMINYDLDVASPVSPGWPPHEELCCGSMSTTFFGTRTSYEVSGWCFLIRREALDAIRPLDERFRFEFQDVDMVEQLKRTGHGKMALVRRSEVVHLLNQSHRLIDNREGMIEGAAAIYEGKYGK